ncbi:hypothetical protein LEP1GSC170_3318 [Leptospira interrogans serovar Bataviae str. HAI135]|nr:hypothetical protein LEP1GSC170_3318 [Leptospira interrogans serovar Bataviae str. HAI135]
MEDKFVIDSIKAEKYIQFFEIKKYQEKCIQIEIEAKQLKKYSFDLDTIKKSIVKEAYQSGLEPQIQTKNHLHIIELLKNSIVKINKIASINRFYETETK